MWSGGGRSKAPVPAISHDCCIPPVVEAARALSGLHIHVIGDSTLRMPVQYFGGRFVCPGQPAHALCARNINKFTPVLDKPMEGLVISFEYNRLTKDILRSEWWAKWVLSDRRNRAPDVVVLGCWLWHTFNGASLVQYEAELRSVIGTLVSQPSYKAWWGAPGRLYWREALPTEHSDGSVQSTTRCKAANSIARRVLAELAPSVVWVTQSEILRHSSARSKRGEATSWAMTKDGLHFHGPVQVMLMRHLLAVIAEERRKRRWTTGSAANASNASTIYI